MVDIEVRRGTVGDVVVDDYLGDAPSRWGASGGRRCRSGAGSSLRLVMARGRRVGKKNMQHDDDVCRTAGREKETRYPKDKLKILNIIR